MIICLITVAWWAVRRYELSYWAASVQKSENNRFERYGQRTNKNVSNYKGGWCSGPPMSALRPILLSLGQFLLSRWAGFPQSRPISSTMFKYKNAMLSEGNRAMPLWISIDTECAGRCLFRLIPLVAVDMAAKDRIQFEFHECLPQKALNLGQRSFVVIHGGTNRYLVHEFI